MIANSLFITGCWKTTWTWIKELKKAEAREGAEARLRIMEDQSEELASLAKQAEKQIPAKAETELLIDLEEEIGQRKETMGDLGRVLKQTAPAELKGRVEQAIQDSVMMAQKGKRYVDHLKARLEFISKDLELGSYKGPTGEGGAPGQWRTAAEELGEEDGVEEEMEEAYGASSEELLNVMRGWGQLKTNDSGWSTLDGRYASYPRFKKEWRAYRETYHSAVNNDLAAKALRDKCIQGDALWMVSHLDDLQEIWETLDTCFERPEKYVEEVLRPVVEFRRYKVADSAAVREFYSLLRATIKGAKGIGRLGLLVNDQTVPKFMGKMPYTDWKEWATRRPKWMQEDLGVAFEEFVERKWQDALNIAAAEPSSWGVEKEKANPGKGPLDKTAYANRGAPKVSGAVNVVGQQTPPRSNSPSWDVSSGRKCQAWYLVGCDGDHVLLQCAKLLELDLGERKEVLKRSGLCLYCLKHAAEVECYGQGGFSKPKCMQTRCDGEHAVSVHRLLGESGARMNLVPELEYESEEDEEWWVGTVRVEGKEEEEETMEEIDEPESETETWYGISTFMRKEDSGLEDELECYWEVHVPSDPYEREEDRWWSPGPPEPSSEEDEEEVRYLTEVLGLGPQGDEAQEGEPPPPQRGWRCAQRRKASHHHVLNKAKSHRRIPRGWSHLLQRRPKGGSLGRRWRETRTTSGR